MAEKLSREVAEIEVEAWLDKKKVFQETRDKYKDYVDIIVEAIMNGVLVLDDKGEFTQILLFPLGGKGEGESSIESIKYRLRVNDKQVSPHMRGVKADDADGRLQALIAAITSQSKSVISNFDSADKRIATAIGIFFM